MDEKGDQWMSPAEVAVLLGFPLKTIYGWNHSGTGPPRYRIGRHVRYLRSEVTAWGKSRRVS
jgi:excisionase family DNA binding protein